MTAPHSPLSARRGPIYRSSRRQRGRETRSLPMVGSVPRAGDRCDWLAGLPLLCCLGRLAFAGHQRKIGGSFDRIFCSSSLYCNLLFGCASGHAVFGQTQWPRAFRQLSSLDRDQARPVRRSDWDQSCRFLSDRDPRPLLNLAIPKPSDVARSCTDTPIIWPTRGIRAGGCHNRAPDGRTILARARAGLPSAEIGPVGLGADHRATVFILARSIFGPAGDRRMDGNGRGYRFRAARCVLGSAHPFPPHCGAAHASYNATLILCMLVFRLICEPRWKSRRAG